ncbi:MAG: glutamine-hydrolyzing carbamoyl-phosphate synthase small subunit [Litorivicinus sp.]
MTEIGCLVLEDGSVFHGSALGAHGESIGEVVFNTAMTGYQEILTDPSYCKQMVTLTYPHIGNTGVNAEDEESEHVWAAGLIVRELTPLVSSYRAEGGLDAYMRDRNVVGIHGIDTRRLTRLLRDKGSQRGVILSGDALKAAGDDVVAYAMTRIATFAGLAGMDLAKVVSTESSYRWTEGTWENLKGFPTITDQRFKVVAYDFGVKRNILRLLAERGCDLTVVPAQTPAAEVLAMNPDGVFLSNGPGDPEPCTYAIDAVKTIIAAGIPVFGICLGHQILSLASGAKTMKMKTGHHGANHPVKHENGVRVFITSQNHGFAVDDSALPDSLAVTHRSLFDGTVQGVRRTDVKAFGFQGHPEASPGPHDIVSLFDQFIADMEAV